MQVFATTAAAQQPASELPTAGGEREAVVPEGSEQIETPPPLIEEVGRGDGDFVAWDPAWRTFSAGEIALTSIAATVAITSAIVGPDESDPWRGPVLFDQGARDALRLENRLGQFVARDISDVLLATLAAYPFLVDSAIVAGWYRDSPEAATQMALINMETLAIAAAVEQLTNVLVSRERPYGPGCGSTIDARTHDCEGGRRYVSFFSGHATIAFTSAGLICTHHMHLPLYGEGAGGGAVCGAALALAATTATLRVVGDQHYASDIIMGSIVGTTLGFGVPWLLHYRHGPRRFEGEDSGDDVVFGVVPVGLGLGVVGRF